jgi:disulfide bond formation protein DsbB
VVSSLKYLYSLYLTIIFLVISLYSLYKYIYHCWRHAWRDRDKGGRGVVVHIYTTIVGDMHGEIEIKEDGE